MAQLDFITGEPFQNLIDKIDIFMMHKEFFMWNLCSSDTVVGFEEQLEAKASFKCHFLYSPTSSLSPGFVNERHFQLEQPLLPLNVSSGVINEWLSE